MSGGYKMTNKPAGCNEIDRWVGIACNSKTCLNHLIGLKCCYESLPSVPAYTLCIACDVYWSTAGSP